MKSKKVNRKLNILYLIHSMTGGGAELVVSNLCHHINREKYNVKVCYLYELGQRGVKLQSEGFHLFTLKTLKYKYIRYLACFELFYYLLKYEIDIIHSHSTNALVIGSLCKLMCFSVRFVHTFHYGNYPYYSSKLAFLEKLFIRFPDRLVAVGQYQKMQLKETFKLSDHQITVLWNGVNKHFQDNIIVDFSKTDSPKFIIGSISTFFYQKGISYLLDVADLLRSIRQDFKFVIVGKGPLEEEIHKKYYELGLEQFVDFKGWVDDANLKILPSFDLFFQPSLWEAMSMVILEAMAAGKPIVATDVGENKIIIRNGVNGFLFKPRDINKAATHIQHMMDNPSKISIFRANNLLLYEKYFTSEAMTYRHEKLYSVMSESEETSYI